jgi:hypothetical protein
MRGLRFAGRAVDKDTSLLCYDAVWGGYVLNKVSEELPDRHLRAQVYEVGQVILS